MPTVITRPEHRRGKPPAEKYRRVLGRRSAIIIGAITALAATVAALLAVARASFDRQLSGEVEELFAAGKAAQPAVLTEAELAGLPEPVQRWLRYSGAVGARRPTTVRLQYDGDFRLGEDAGWLAYESQTYYTTNPPALLWTVKMRIFPLVSVVGRDRYADGEGSITMKALSLVPVAQKRGGGLDQGALLRYLGETVWFPAGAVAPYISWAPGDANAAIATMSHGGVTASATFQIDDEGRVTEITAERYNDAKGRPERWSVPITAYGELGGVRVPVAGEGVWQYDSGDFSYIRWRLTDLEYDRPARY